jgi:hypothetical protein
MYFIFYFFCEIKASEMALGAYLEHLLQYSMFNLTTSR